MADAITPAPPAPQIGSAIDWGSVAFSGLALLGVGTLFFLALRFADQTRGKKKRNPISTRVQSLLFSRDAGWTVSSANAWARAHGYRAKDADVTANNVRLRQADPGRFSRLRTVTFSKAKGIKAIIGR
jgi:hypothetical protein